MIWLDARDAPVIVFVTTVLRVLVKYEPEVAVPDEALAASSSTTCMVWYIVALMVGFADAPEPFVICMPLPSERLRAAAVPEPVLTTKPAVDRAAIAARSAS